MKGLANLEYLSSVALLTLVIIIALVVEGQEENSTIATAMKRHKVVPDVLSKPPANLLEVRYGIKRVNLGNTLLPSEVVSQPTLFWNGEPHSYYTACMIDPDAPSRSNPKAREWQHWLVVNIPGNELEKGDVLSTYAGSTPPKGSGFHRYVLVVYKQPGILKFDEAKILSNSGGSRAKFSISDFSEKYNLGDPLAGNFFQAEWED